MVELMHEANLAYDLLHTKHEKNPANKNAFQ